ncbi:GTPase IMAP family member 6-like [Vipera latastei]
MSWDRAQPPTPNSIRKRQRENSFGFFFLSSPPPTHPSPHREFGLMAHLAIMEIERGEELRLILVGKSGGGKSTTGNTILRRRAFESILAVKNTTLRCQREQGTWQGRKVSVVDTPSIFDSENYNEIVRREIISCVELSRPGPHALILVTQVGRFTAEDATAAKCVQDIFGAESAKHTIVLFTCLQDLGGDPLQEYVQKSDNRNLRDLIQQCGNHFCGFNNKAVGAEQERQLSELMAMVQSVVFKNRGQYYVNRLYGEPSLREEHVRIFIKQNRAEASSTCSSHSGRKRARHATLSDAGYMCEACDDGNARLAVIRLLAQRTYRHQTWVGWSSCPSPSRAGSLKGKVGRERESCQFSRSLSEKSPRVLESETPKTPDMASSVIRRGLHIRVYLEDWKGNTGRTWVPNPRGLGVSSGAGSQLPPRSYPETAALVPDPIQGIAQKLL